MNLTCLHLYDNDGPTLLEIFFITEISDIEIARAKKVASSLGLTLQSPLFDELYLIQETEFIFLKNSKELTEEIQAYALTEHGST